MKTVEIKINVDKWYAHAEAGGMRFTYYGGTCCLIYGEHMKSMYVDPHTKKYPGEDVFIMDMINKALAMLKEPCHIILDIPERSFPYSILRKRTYEYWKDNNWCFKSGLEAGEEWIEFDRLITEKGHTFEVK